MLDLFAHKVDARLPARYVARGRVGGNLVAQLSTPGYECEIRFIERHLRQRRILIGDRPDGSRIALLPPSLQIPKDCNDAVIVGEVLGYGEIEDALRRPSARWHGSKPRNPNDLPMEDWSAVHRDIRNTWAGTLNLASERYESGMQVQKGFRPPQIGAIHAVKAHWIVSNEPAIVMPTGTGKTETMLAILLSEPIDRLLVIVPTDALRTQLGVKFLTLGVLKDLGCLKESAAYPVVAILKRALRPSLILIIFSRGLRSSSQLWRRLLVSIPTCNRALLSK